MDSNEADLVKFKDKLEIKPNSNLNLRNKSNLEKCTKTDKKDCRKLLLENPLGCDLTLCLFIAALKCFRADTCLRPFPQYYLTSDKEKNFKLLRSVCTNIPSIQSIIRSPKSCADNVWDLLNWLFLEKQYPILIPVKKHTIPLIFEEEHTIPHYVFEVKYAEKFENIWQSRIQNKEVLQAFHGSHVQNFYSITNFGLQQNFSNDKEVLFGKGIYLSNELSMCMNYAPFGETWENSCLGTKHSIIAVCDIINDPNKVKTKNSTNIEEVIPEKYFIVTDSELVKLKYILIYRQKSHSFVGSFIKKNLFFILLFMYFVMLIGIGIFK